MQLDPPLGGIGARPARGARTSSRVRAASRFVDVNDNADGARPHERADGLRARSSATAGLETIPHLTPRDSTMMGLESILLGAHAEGVRNVLAVTGDPPEVGDYPGSRGVYEVDAIGLTQPDRAPEPRRGLQRPRRSTRRRRSSPASPSTRPPTTSSWRPSASARKIEAGARFAMTQIVFDLDVPRAVRSSVLGGSWPIPLLVGVFPLTSHRLALRLHNEVPGIVVPEALQERSATPARGAAEVGLAHARELVAGGARPLRRRVRRRAVPAAARACSSCWR